MYTTRRAALAALTGFTALAALAGGLVAGPAGPASASPIDGHEIVDEPSAGGSGPSQTAVAECPTGKSLIGTGAMIGSASRAIVLTSIVPNLVTDSVEVTAHETPAGTTQNWTVHATAVCANDNEIPAMYLEDASDAPDANGHAGAAAACNAGDVALGAGFELSGPAGRIHLTSVLPTVVGSGLATAHEEAAGVASAWDVTAYAMCAVGVTPHAQFRMGTTNQRVDCPAGTSVAGAGGFATDSLANRGTYTLLLVSPSDFGATDSVGAGAVRLTAAPAPNLAAFSYAMCLDMP